MLLINFFKKASGLLFCEKKKNLMLFLCSKPIKFTFVSCFFLNTSNAINTFAKDDSISFQLRILNANERLQVQESNFLIYVVICLIFVFFLSIFIMISLKKIDNQGQKEIAELNKIVLKQKNKGLQQQQQIKLYSNLCYNLDLRLNQMRLSINNICNEFLMNDTKWNNEINKIYEFATKMGLEYSKSISIIKKM